MREGAKTLELRAQPSQGLVLGPRYSILTWPDKRLRQPAQPVVPSGLAAQEALEAMSTVWKPDWAGLAAPQLGLPYQVIALPLEGKPVFLLNPRILQRAPELITEEEGCLSLPGLRLHIPRPVWVVAEAQDPLGDRKILRFQGFLARAFCHELDHLEGVLLLDHLSAKERKAAVRKLEEAQAERARRIILPAQVQENRRNK